MTHSKFSCRGSDDIKDPGGRLGPYLENDQPDLRNMSLFFVSCHEGDLILAVTDGVSDNFDPVYLGRTPQSYGFSVENDSWKAAPAHPAFKELDDQRHNDILNLIKHELGAEYSPEKIVKLILNYCENLTSVCHFKHLFLD